MRRKPDINRYVSAAILIALFIIAIGNFVFILNEYRFGSVNSLVSLIDSRQTPQYRVNGDDRLELLLKPVKQMLVNEQVIGLFADCGLKKPAELSDHYKFNYYLSPVLVHNGEINRYNLIATSSGLLNCDPGSFEAIYQIDNKRTLVR